MKKFTVFLSFIFSLTTTVISSQNHFRETITKNLLEYSEKNYPEKVYVHTDKKYYSNEDTVWFSTYLVNGITLKKSDKSKLVYVELINPNDSIISRKKFFIDHLNTAGDFKLNKELISGNYKIRAYTNYMRNQDAHYFFQKEITLLSKKKQTITKNIKINDNEVIENSNFKPVLKFYPQGGYLVNGLLNKVALKIENIIFDELTYSGVLIDQNNNEILKFSTSEFGFGKINFMPEKGNSYVAVIKNNDAVYKYKLPNALEEGFILNTSNLKNEVIVELKSNTLNGLLGTSLLIHERGRLIVNQTFTNTIHTKILKIPISKLNTGIINLTLFNSNGQPVAERLVFVENNNKKAKIILEKSKKYFGNRKKVTLKIKVENNANIPIDSNLSLSVTDLNSLDENYNSENIKTWLLLNSDLPGKINNPGYFFEDNNIKKRKYLLDLLMLTNGWRRFTWQEIISKSRIKPKYKNEIGIIISGKTLEKKPPYHLKSLPTKLTLLGETIRQEPIKNSNASGEFSYGPYIFFDSIPIILEARLKDFKIKEDTNREVLIIPKKVENIAPILIDSIALNLKNNKTEINSYLKIQKYLDEINSKFNQSENVLDEIVINSKLKTEKKLREEKMNSQTSYGDATYRYDVSKNGFENNTLLDLFFNVPGVTVTDDSLVINRFKEVTPLILLDEMRIDVSELSSIPATEISFIDVLMGGEASIFSSNGAVISIYSKQIGDYAYSSNVKRKPGVINYNAVGFYTAQEFYTPDHVNGIEEQIKADIRTTLHWQPVISIAGKNEVEVSFYTSDVDSKYLIKLEGITSTGIPLYQTSEIIVD
jgi:hypothetical protein